MNDVKILELSEGIILHLSEAIAELVSLLKEARGASQSEAEYPRTTYIDWDPDAEKLAEPVLAKIVAGHITPTELEGRVFGGRTYTIWRTACDVYLDGEPVTEVTVVDRLIRLNKLAEVGGMAYIVSLRDRLPVSDECAPGTGQL